MQLLKYLLFPIYLLQLENYNLERFWRGSITYLFKRPKIWRKQIAWTNKLKLVYAVALVLILMFASVFSGIWEILILAASLVFLSPFLALATILIKPIEQIIKNNIVARAKHKLTSHPNLTVIGIAGSYGKTTMKEMVTSVLKQKYHVLSTPETTNTPIGIARLIINELSNDDQMFVVEMGEFWHGDVKELCELVNPSIGIITGINEAHLERLGSFDTTIDTIFELARFSKPNGLLLLNADDVHVISNYQKYTGNHKVAFFSSTNSELSGYTVSDVVFDEDGGRQSFKLTHVPPSVIPAQAGIHKNKDMDSGQPSDALVASGMTLKTKLLGHYAIGTSMAGVILGKELGLNDLEIQKGIENLEPVPHRLQPIWNKENNVLVIDDSFNGNPDGVREAIAVLAQFKNRRKVYLTPGLVEAGPRTTKVHQNIGKQLATVADIVLLIQNSVSQYIIEGLKAGGFSEQNISVFPTTQAAHASLGQVLKPGDVILFQNDWPDNYN